MFAEFRFAARALARWRGGAAVAALTLAIGIGTTTSLAALVRVLLEDMPGVPALDRIARVYASSHALGVERSPVALNEFDSTLSRATSFSAIGAYADIDATIGTGQAVQPVIAGYATPGFFAAMGVPPAEGRVFTPADLETSTHPVILGQALWHRQFPNGQTGRDTIVVDGVERTVIGVMPPEFRYGFVGIGADLWLPLGSAGPTAPAIVSVYARLRDGVGWPAAGAELAALSQDRAPWTWRAIPIGDDTRYRAIGAYAGTLGPAILILLIACVNVACLLMARGIAREKELTVRRALGATRLRVVRLLVIENLVLALIAGAIGGALAVVILRVLSAQLAGYQPALAARVAVDLGLLPVALGSSAVACLLFGTIPALRLSRRDVAASLNGVPPTHRIEIAGYGGRDVIVFAEIASAAGLIVWTAMLYTLFTQIGAIKLAFPADRVVAMRVAARDVEDVAARVAGVPGVTRTTVSAEMLGGPRVRVESGGVRVAMSRVPVGEGFLETLGVPLLRGRPFDAAELHGRAAVVILNESGARQLSPDGNALGLRIQISERSAAVVIGICRDAIDYGALSKADAYAPADLYVPYESSPASGEAVVLARLSTDPHGALRGIAAAAQVRSGAKPARPVILSEEMNSRGVDGAVVTTRVLGAFAVLTLLLAASGIFAVLSQSVAQRTREFGIRLAVGATPRGVLSMVLAREAKLIGLGIAVGLAFSMGLTRALFAELVRLNAVVPGMWILALVLSSTVAAAACLLATWRIVCLEPATVLRRP